MPELKQAHLNAQAADRLRKGYPWVFASQITQWSELPEPGELTALVDSQGVLLGFGYANPNQVLAIKFLYTAEAGKRGLDGIPDEKTEIHRKLDRCRSRRLQLQLDSDAYRLVWSEADGLPGFICDVYHDWVVVQFLTHGMDRRREWMIKWIRTRLNPNGIYERSEGQGRRMEGLPARSGWLWHKDETVPDGRCLIHEGSDVMQVEFAQGHKTGFYLDQRAARRMLRGLPLHGRSLDAFCHSGGFSLAAVRAGSAHVDAIDQDEGALRQLNANAELNHMAGAIHSEKADVFDYLRQAAGSRKSYDTIILDPPSFVRSRTAVASAMRGYRELHLQAGRLINPGGWLLTCTCSHFIQRDMFRKMVLGTMKSSGKPLAEVRVFGPDQDHPEKPQIPESRYLTCLLARVKKAVS